MIEFSGANIIVEDKKRCYVCSGIKNISEFYKNRSRKDGFGDECKSCHKKLANKRRKENRDKESERHKQYRKENYDKIREYENTPQRKISNNLRSRLSGSIKSNLKGQVSAVSDLGCSIKMLMYRLKRNFYKHPETGEIMTWDNYGKRWDIDHFIPLSSFDLTDPEQVKKACHYKNLQPLWGKHNRIKGPKILTVKENQLLKQGKL